uniref:BTB domain-containing protein n=1 Tax=Panagrolaimus davidi TaxID=227884 RepID=A0A914QWX9_9BILA
MKSMNYINKIHHQLDAAFKSQDPDLFDIVFDFEGKKLYADKLILSINSSTFKSMLSDRWISKNDSIKIETYKFDDFKELLTYIYSGKCNITNENISRILDMSEFYQIEDLKKLCDEFLSKMEVNLSNIIQLFETLNKYPLIQMKKTIQTFIFQNFETLLKSDEFLNAKKSVVKEIIALGQTFAIKYEEMFQAAYEWSENQAIKKQKESTDKNFNMNDAIKVEMQEFLPYIQLNQIEISFFTKYVVKKGFIFNFDELSDILESVQSNVKVKITNLHGQSVYGLLPKENSAVSIIKSLQQKCSLYKYSAVFWKINCDMPSTPSALKKRIGAKCYLRLFVDGYIGISTDHADKNYLLAEMFSEYDFEFTQKCKIEIV